MEDIASMFIVALFVCILFSVVNQNKLMKQVSLEIDRKRKIDNQKFIDILSQYQKYMDEFQKTSMEINKSERKKLEKYIKESTNNKNSIQDLLIQIPNEIRHNPKIILDEDIYAHVNNVMGLVSENLPKLEEKGFIKNQNVDKLINSIKNKEVFSEIGNNKVNEVKEESYNSNFDNSFHSYSQNNQMFSEPYANSSELENYTFLQNAHTFNPNFKNSSPNNKNGSNPYSYLGGKKI